MDTFLHAVQHGVHVRELDTKKASLTAEELLQNAAPYSQCPRLQAVCRHCLGHCFLGGNSSICPSLLCYHQAQLSTEVLRMQTGSSMMCSLRDGSVWEPSTPKQVSVCADNTRQTYVGLQPDASFRIQKCFLGKAKQSRSGGDCGTRSSLWLGNQIPKLCTWRTRDKTESQLGAF